MKPLPFSTTLAHPPHDLLSEHLLRVAQQARDSIANGIQSAREIAFIAGLFHDIGKATYYFQVDRLKNKKKNELTKHSEIGAILSWWYTAQLNWEVWQRIAVFNAIHRHHSPLNVKSWDHFLTLVWAEAQYEDSHLHEQLLSMDLLGIQQWLEGLAADSNFLPRKLPNLTKEAVIDELGKSEFSEIESAFQTLEQAVLALAGFGGLLANDKLDTATQGQMFKRQKLPANAVNAVETYKKQKFSITSSLEPLNQQRTAIAEEVLHTWLQHQNHHLFTFTAPTGSGKTLAILNAALHIRDQIQQQTGNTPRIIYCLPFTAIIDQNYAVFNDVLATQLDKITDDILLKHHHLTDYVFQTKEAEYLADGAGQLLTETWQSELVVTTFYQLLYTLLSAKNANLKRAGQLTGSIVLMDEVQAIPIKYWKMIRHLFESMATALNTRFVLLTATRPLIFEPDASTALSTSKAIELLPHHVDYFKSLSRVQLHCYHQQPISLEAFAEKFTEQHQADARPVLIIVNRKSAVRQLYELLTERFPERLILALSTFFTPRDRQIRIRLMQRWLRKNQPCMVLGVDSKSERTLNWRWLRKNQPCIVITTQLIEAGVDVSFPTVHRDLAPLDSIIQSAGRCNRHHEEQQQGQVFLWQLYTDKQNTQPHWVKIYDPSLIEITNNVLKQSIYQESEFLQLGQDYFQQTRFSDDQKIEEWLKSGDFNKIEENFQLIEEKPQRSLFIVKKPKDKQLWDKYCEIYRDDTTSPLEKHKRFSEIRREFYERMIQVWGNSKELIEKASDSTYTKQVGFIG